MIQLGQQHAYRVAHQVVNTLVDNILPQGIHWRRGFGNREAAAPAARPRGATGDVGPGRGQSYSRRRPASRAGCDANAASLLKVARI